MDAGDAAIIGMACIFPGAPDLRTYWENIVAAVDAIGDPPEDWDADLFYDPESNDNDRTYCKRGGYLRDLAAFDPIKYGVMPTSVEGEPDQFLALRVAHDALADAGYLDRPIDRERVEVVIGRGTYINRGLTTVVQHGLVVDQVLRILRQLHPEHTDDELRILKRELKSTLPPFNAEIAPGLVPNLVSGRIANRLDFMGANYTVDAACASSHIAVQRGIEDLARGACDIALVGGVHASTPAPILMIFSQLGALSRTGRLRPFDRRADGTLLGEGLGLMVLKRYADAKRDADRVYAVIKGVGVASDGRGTGLLAPRVDGEELALRRAYANANVSPDTVSLIEAHGTGTPVGDAAEIEALRRVFGERQGDISRCAIGSVKSMISHLIPAAGAAGIIKTALALYHKVLPPTLHSDEPDPKLGIDQSPFYINSETRPWIHGARTPRRAGVNAFGFGGINAHAVLEEHVAAADESSQPALHRHWDSEAVIVQAESREALVRECARLARTTEAAGDAALRDVAWTWNSRLGDSPEWRLGLVCSTLDDLRRKLAYAGSRLAEPSCSRIRDVSGIYFFEQQLARRGRVAFVFPGEGSQYPGMLADLCIHFPQVRVWFDLIDRAFVDQGREYLASHVIFPPPGAGGADRRTAERRLWQMDCAAEAVFAASQALLQLLSDCRISPDAVVGHSTGEYSAFIASGVNPIVDREKLIRDIGDLNTCYQQFVATGRLSDGVLLTVGGVPLELIAGWVADRPDLYLAMDNCPHQAVLFGSAASIDAVVDEVKRRGGLCSRLPFNRAYHTPLFAPFCAHVAEFFERIPMTQAAVDLYSCANAAKYPADPAAARALAVAQWARPVRFRETIQTMYDDGARIFVEVGPRNHLTAFIDDVLGRHPHLAVALNLAHRSAIAQLNHAIAQLAAHGVPMSLDALYARRAARNILAGEDCDPPAIAPVKLPMGLQTMRLKTTGLQPRAVTPPSSDQGASTLETPAPTSVPRSDARAGIMQAHLAMMRRFLDIEQEVIGTYFASSGAQRTTERDAAAGALPAHPVTVPSVADEGLTTFSGGNGNSDAVNIEQTLVDLVAERTGYPPETIGLTLDLEADLGVDSIKRVEILGALQQHAAIVRNEDMDRLAGLRTLRQILDVLRERDRNASPACDERPVRAGDVLSEPTPALPLIGTITAFSSGRELVAIRTLDVEEDLFLRHHTLGRDVSAIDDRLTGLPIVPLTISIEMLAEAGKALFPERTVIGLKRVRGYRWIALDRGRVTLQLVAKAREEGLVDVRVVAASGRTDGATSESPLVEGTVVLARGYPEPPAPSAVPLTAARKSTWTDDTLYADIMFHGPQFRAVASMDRWGENGADATLRTLPPDGMFRSMAEPQFQTDPVVLDAAGQVVAYWVAEGFDRAIHVFPFRVEELQLFGPPTAAGQSLRCHAHIQTDGDAYLRSNIDLVDADRRLRARVSGWEDKRFDLPDAFYRLRVAPHSTCVTERWDLPVGRAGRNGLWSCRRLESLSREFLESHDRIWQRVLAHLVLSRRERDVWADLDRPPARRIDWLLGRIAAKDAVRDLVSAAHEPAVHPADIEIEPDERGRPMVARLATHHVVAPSISIAHAHRTAVAIAVDASRRCDVGIDMERMRPASDGFVAAAFTEREQTLIAPLAATRRDEWVMRLWCAKEAAAKALGEGLLDGPRHIGAEALDLDTGVVHVVVGGELARRAGASPHLTAETFCVDDLIVAICLYERS